MHAHIPKELPRELRLAAAATLVDLLRNGPQPYRSQAAWTLHRFPDLVREAMPAEADAITVEAAELVLGEAKRELAARRAR